MSHKYLLFGACAVAAVAAAYSLLRPEPTQHVRQLAPPEVSALVEIQMPQIEGNAVIGQRIFASACAECHGSNAVGIEGVGPPLIHVIYEPSHHADESFQRAVAMGVKSHHWRFGDMLPVGGLTRGDVAMVIAYIREIQHANGIN
ncbi:cytochrome c [Phaeobacter sp. C3_T13_0]|uniref:cytochrome c n=1 Tax=Phaeobacter cretensis TaxID=3342641 RepID=UPI0039BC6306